MIIAQYTVICNAALDRHIILVYNTINFSVNCIAGGCRLGIQITLKALADPTRRDILNMLKRGSLSAGAIAEHFNMSAPAISKHLNVLKDADLIRDRREGKYIYYELNASVLEEVLLWMKELTSGDQ